MAGFFDQYDAMSRTLSQLQLQKAKFSLNVPVSIANEIEDLERALHSHPMTLLLTYQRNLRQLLNQRAIFGAAQVSIHIENQIADQRTNILRVTPQASQHGFRYTFTPGIEEEEVVSMRQGFPPPRQSQRIGQHYQINIDGSWYTGVCTADDGQHMAIEWQYDGLSFTVSGPVERFIKL